MIKEHVPEHLQEMATPTNALLLAMSVAVTGDVGAELTNHQIVPIEQVITADNQQIAKIKKPDHVIVGLEKQAAHVHNQGAITFLSQKHHADVKKIMTVRSHEPKAPTEFKHLELEGGPMLLGAVACALGLSTWTRLKHRRIAAQKALKT